MASDPQYPTPELPQPQAFDSQQPAVPVDEVPAEEPPEDEPPRRGRRFLLFNAVPSWMISLMVHTVLLIVLAFIVVAAEEKNTVTFDGTPSEKIQDELDPVEEPIDDEIDIEVVELSSPVMVDADPIEDVQPIDLADDIEAAPAEIEFTDFADRVAPKTDLMKTVEGVSGTAFEGRGEAARGQMATENGGTKESDTAVRDALDWIMRHQLPDGGWSFDHRIGPGTRSTSNPGKLANARSGATAMALLPFLGYGIVPTPEMMKSKDEKTREWARCVNAGIEFLIYDHGDPRDDFITSSMGYDVAKIGNGTLSYSDDGGRMYSHGLCAITLCEAYGMTHSKKIMPYAQRSLNFIVYAQDPVGGGWRYRPREAGDTSVVGWQLMALKSGHMAYLKVPPSTVRGCSHFLDSVQANSGANYGYTTPGSGLATTSVGLLCRMYLGWKKDHEALERGVAVMSAKGPSNNMYYNYYATQVMRHFGDEPWEKWNNVMRPKLVNSQAKAGPDKGSWYIGGDHGAGSGGRLYCTSMATMVLEVYYRHMPIYKQDAADDDFQL